MADTKLDIIEVLQKDDWCWCAGEMVRTVYDPWTRTTMTTAECAVAYLLRRIGVAPHIIETMTWDEIGKVLQDYYRLGERDLPRLAEYTIITVNDECDSKRKAVERIIEELLASPLTPVSATASPDLER